MHEKSYDVGGKRVRKVTKKKYLYWKLTGKFYPTRSIQCRSMILYQQIKSFGIFKLKIIEIKVDTKKKPKI